MAYVVVNDDGAMFCGINFQHKPVLKVLDHPEYTNLPPYIKPVVFKELSMARDIAREYGLYVYKLSYAGVPI